MSRATLLVLLALGACPPAPANAQSTATTVVQVAIDRMGGLSLLDRVERARLELVTLWHRQTFEDRPFGDVVGSYERVTDERDYTIPAWRNTRRFLGGGAPSGFEVIDLVRDSVASRFAPTGPSAPAAWAPLNIAYVTERRELFTFSPERLLPLALRAGDLASLPDTMIAGQRQARVRATVEGFPATLSFDRGTGLLTRAHFRASQPDDFGLAPYGVMDVDLWYGLWRMMPAPSAPGLRYPTQIDIARLGVPYKRLTVLSARFDVAAMPDSFAVGDEVRTRYHATATRPMWEVPLDSGRIVNGRFAVLGTPGFAPQAVKVGSAWMLLEGSAVPERAGAEDAWLRSKDGAGFGAVVVTAGAAPRGGLAWFARKRLPASYGPGAAKGAAAVLRNWEVTTPPGAVARARWIRMGGDSVLVEPFDAPGAPGGLIAYVPSLRWVYHALAVDPFVKELVMERVRQRGWAVDRLGHARALDTPLAPAAGAAR